MKLRSRRLRGAGPDGGRAARAAIPRSCNERRGRLPGQSHECSRVEGAAWQSQLAQVRYGVGSTPGGVGSNPRNPSFTSPAVLARSRLWSRLRPSRSRLHHLANLGSFTRAAAKPISRDPRSDGWRPACSAQCGAGRDGRGSPEWSASQCRDRRDNTRRSVAAYVDATSSVPRVLRLRK